MFTPKDGSCFFLKGPRAQETFWPLIFSKVKKMWPFISVGAFYKQETSCRSKSKILWRTFKKRKKKVFYYLWSSFFGRGWKCEFGKKIIWRIFLFCSKLRKFLHYLETIISMESGYIALNEDSRPLLKKNLWVFKFELCTLCVVKIRIFMALLFFLLFYFYLLNPIAIYKIINKIYAKSLLVSFLCNY